MLSLIALFMVIISTFLLFLRYLFSGDSSSLLSAIPTSHFLAPYTRYWLVWLKGTGCEHRVRHAAHARLGPIVRIGPNEISVTCIENGVQTIYGGSFEKAAWYLNFQNYGQPSMFAMGHNKPHSERKCMLTHVCSKSYIQNSPELNEIIHHVLSERLLPKMRTWAKNGVPINVHEENKACIMDLTTAYFFGLGNGTNFVQDPAQTALLKNFELGMSGLFWIAEVPGITKLAGIFGIKLIADGVFQSYQLMEDLCTNMCKSAKSNLSNESTNKAHPTVYAQLRSKLEEAKIPSELLDVTIVAEMLDHIQAGHEGTGITLTFLMCELSRNPTLMVQLREELATLGTSPSAQSIDNLPLLDALLMETMRLYPGSFGPASVYSLHRNPKVFPDPEEWRPERWIEASGEKKKEMMK
ncbi:cytochrome P450 [Mollisia scopiformis]|uniref:Cytochrome P450 n=1 Tax=Mollisia scopiformis TaxID=149040 RepID=A0A194X6S2_MOLSC|nr:cytochrome P450 [Mollisia scopiformis]KUJ15875.1 cytochrome P450 [Mollisia scopiformis]